MKKNKKYWVIFFWKKKTPQRYLDDKKRFVVTQGIEKMGMNLGQSAGKTYT